MTVTLQTELSGPVDLSPGQIVAACYAAGIDPVYNRATVEEIARLIVDWSKIFGFRTSPLAAQILHETGRFRYGGQVKPEQWNFAGLGATNDGSVGASFPDISTGVLAVCCHRALYQFGDIPQWPEQLRQYAEWAIRRAAVRSAGYFGVTKTIGDFTNGRWAWSPQYPTGSLQNGYALAMVRIANELHNYPPEQEDKPMSIKVALAAGHRNSDGGNAVERELVAEHCYATAQALRAAGADVRVVTPDDGRGVFPGGLQAVAQRVVDWHNAGWTANLFLEFHTNGPGGRGVFAIYPDTDNDVDADVRDTLGPAMARAVAKQTGMPVWGNGAMSERNTGVGRQGYRLGVFLRSEPLRQTTERMLIESGFHSDPRDLAILRRPETPARIAQGVVEAVFDFYKQPVAEPPEAEDPNARYFDETGHWIINQTFDDGRIAMLDHWRDTGGIAVNGYPLAGMTKDDDGVYRQLCENVLMEAWLPGTWGDNSEIVYRNGGLGRRYRDLKIDCAELQATVDGHDGCDCA